MRRLVVTLAVLCLALAGLSTAASAKMKIKFGHVAPPFHGQSKGVEAFAKYVMEKTGGEIEIKTFPMGQLGSERSMAEQVQAGTLEIASITTAVLHELRAPGGGHGPCPLCSPTARPPMAVIDDPEFKTKDLRLSARQGLCGRGLDRERVPRHQQHQKAHCQALRPQGHEDPGDELPGLHGHLQAAGRLPGGHPLPRDLQRPSAGRDRRPGKPASTPRS
jgi:hypothetical protein